jgi:glucose-fructose oxidoreductase
LPAFAHARRNSRLVAIVSDDRTKRRELAKKYGVETYRYDDYETCLEESQVDAVYIALPNSMHAEYTIRAGRLPAALRRDQPEGGRARAPRTDR